MLWLETMLNLYKVFAAAIFAVFGVGFAAPAAHAEPVPLGAEMVLGDPNAKVTIIEYASMSCPHCARFDTDVFPQVKADFIDTGKVKFVFREFPLDQPAMYGALLAKCAGTTRFFAFVDLLFKQQQQWVQAPDVVGRLAQLGQLGGVTTAEWQACLANRDLQNGIIQSRLDAEKAPYIVQSTPTFFINMVKFEGEQPYETFAKAIADALSGKAAAPAIVGAATPAAATSGNQASTYIYIAVAVALIAGAAFFFLRRPQSAGPKSEA